MSRLEVGKPYDKEKAMQNAMKANVRKYGMSKRQWKKFRHIRKL